MSAAGPALLGFLAVLVLFALGASAAGLMLDRAARNPATAATLVVALVIGLSWGGVLLLGE
jgi:hypothetical protein